MNSFRLGIVGISLYFIYHLVNGQYGLISWAHVRQDIKKNEKTLQELTSKKEYIENLVNFLKPSHIDPDLLDERARLMLGYAHKDEKVIILQKNNS